MTETAAQSEPQQAITPPPPKKRKHRRTRVPDQQSLARLDFESGSGFDLAQRITTALAASSIVPSAFRGGPGSAGWANAFIALELAHRLKFPPLLVMQNITLIDGRPGWQGKFYVALIQAGGQFRDYDWEWKGQPGGDDYGARMVAFRIQDGKRCDGEWVDIKLAKAEGWWSKKDKNGHEWSKWPTMTAQMLVYRSAAFWTNKWNPAATLGLSSVEELLDVAKEEARLVAPAAPPKPAEPQVVLDAGVDPPSMAHSAPPAHEPEEFRLIRGLLAKGDRRAAIDAVKRLPADLQKAGMELYTRENS